MNALIVLALCMVAVNAYKPMGPPVTTNVHDRSANPRIVGGEPASATQAPWQISLNSASWLGTSHICGGSLLGKRTVLTAAHCCDGGTTSSLSVKYGGLDRTKLANTRKVTKITMHPSYSSSTIDNDYCVLALDADANEETNVKYIKLAQSSPPTGTKADLTGWGRTSGSGGALPTALMHAQFDILSASECNTKWGDVNPVTKNMICAQNKAASGCNGDSGGPLVANGELVGVVSWGANGCPADTTVRPTVYADPAESSARAWILSTAGLP